MTDEVSEMYNKLTPENKKKVQDMINGLLAAKMDQKPEGVRS